MPRPPSENPVRRNARVGPLVLPAGGRQGDTPDWPLELVSSAELGLWKDLWATPQAVAWERLGFTRVVARYCRFALLAENGNKDAFAEARQLEDRLGLTPKAMRLLLWTISADEVAEKRAEKGQGAPERTARGRIKAVG
jgi:hypothetical protein